MDSKNGGDCDSVGTWVPSPTGFAIVGGTCTLTKDIQITGTGVGITYCIILELHLMVQGHTDYRNTDSRI